MKKIKLFALTALFCAMGTNAFAVEPTYAYRSINGLIYKYQTDAKDKDGSEATKAYPATIFGMKAAPTDKSLTVTASVSFTNDLEETKYIEVTGFEKDWDKKAKADAENSVPARVDVFAAIETLSIEGAKLKDLTNAFTNLTALKSLTFTTAPDAWVNTGFVTGELVVKGNAKIKETLTTIDLTGLAKATAVPAENTFAQLPKLTSITLPAGITEIGANAFKGLEITEITIPEKVETIGGAAFKNTKLTAITLPATLKSFGAEAFEYTPLTSIVIPEKVTTISNYAFHGCEALTSVDISAATGLTTIGNSAFEGAKVLATFDLSSATELTTIGTNAFKGTAIASVVIPNKVTSIGANAFEGCEALASFSVAAPAKAGAKHALATIGASVFKGCTALASADLTNTEITVLNQKYFEGCEALTAIKLAKSIYAIAEDEFADCAIENLDFSVCETFTNLRAIFGARTEKNPNPLKTITLPETLTTINKGVFDYATSLTEITIPASVNKLPAEKEHLFYYCTSLKTVTYEPTSKDNSATFAADAFLGCTPWVKINTNAYYFEKNPNQADPTNATFGGADELTFSTNIEDKGTSGKWFGKICPKVNVEITKADLGDVKLYSVYTDEGIAYFQALTIKSGKYAIKAGEHVIAKADSEQEIEFVMQTATPPVTSLATDDIFSVTEAVNTADFQDGTKKIKNSKGSDVTFTAGTSYIYALTNSKANGGFGFTYYKGATLPAGAFFIISDLAPTKAARLQTIWLDENGNVENEATAIESVNNVEDNAGEIFNLQGVRVNGVQKGIYIKNGKKFIVK